MISIENLSKKYGTLEVLKNISLNLEKGKVYGIVGENGAGKTTLFRCILGLEPYQKGNIQTDWLPLKNHTGYLPSEPYFLSKITGKEYLQLWCNARNIKIQDFNQKNIFDLPLERYAEQYSTGMKKKLALLAILLQKNDFFILDEPFNGVDIQSNLIITEIIHHLKAENKIILLSSHIFSTLQDTCDEICLLKDGSIAQKCSKNEFAVLEKEMKSQLIGNKIQRLF